MLPHCPQFIASALVSVQVPLQFASGTLQLQLPVTHSSSASHWLPHWPQLRRSDVMSMQRPLHDAWPLGHEAVHMPFWQMAPAAQVRPHEPQFASSLERSEHRPPHVVSLP